jgi:DNA repair protein RadC
MDNLPKLTINQWAEEDRPREKMMSRGVEVLSDAELLAILIGSGNTEESAVELMRRVLASCNNNLNELGKWALHDYLRFKGLGPAKATTIMSALELGKRRKVQDTKEQAIITCSTDIYYHFYPLMCDLLQEEFWVMLLNQTNKVLNKIRISSGGIDAVHADVRTILREALIYRATGIVLCHNHPSGNKYPSPEDVKLTEKIQQSAQIMDIRLSDHLIICDGSYYSFADEGKLGLYNTNA